MNKLLFIWLFLSLGMSCTTGERTKESENETQVEQPEDLIERMPNFYREYFPGKKQIKLMGPLDSEGNRHGAWESFFEHGQKNSATYFVHGKKDGHSIVYYPNGATYYMGEYKNDQKIGVWKQFDEQGNLISQEDFSNHE